jgi:hypothetical protein
MTKIQTMAELMAEEEARLIAEANSPERIAADAAQIARNHAKVAAELESLERQGMVVKEGEEIEEDEEEEDGETCPGGRHHDTGRGVCADCGEFL